MSTDTTTKVTDYVAFDDAQYARHERAGKTEARLETVRNRQHTMAGDRRETVGRRYTWRRTAAEIWQTLEVMRDVHHDAAAGAILAQEQELLTELAQVVLEINENEKIYRQPQNRWNRYFRCLNSDGHIHSSLRGCPSVHATTPMGWNTRLSGQLADVVVKDLGPTLCSICFPTAPVEWRQKKSDVEREAREAAKAAKAEARFGKMLRPGEVITVGHGRFYDTITTVAAAKDALRKEVEFRDYYGHGVHCDHEPWAAAAVLATEVLLAREARKPGTGATQAEIDRIIASAVKRNIKDGARLDPQTGESTA